MNWILFRCWRVAIQYVTTIFDAVDSIQFSNHLVKRLPVSKLHYRTAPVQYHAAQNEDEKHNQTSRKPKVRQKTTYWRMCITTVVGLLTSRPRTEFSFKQGTLQSIHRNAGIFEFRCQRHSTPVQDARILSKLRGFHSLHWTCPRFQSHSRHEQLWSQGG